MNPLQTTTIETFKTGRSNLDYFCNRLVKLTNGVILFCTNGEAEITIDLEKYHVVPNTNIMLLPGSILSLRSASKDFQLVYFAYSSEMIKLACFRLEPTFMQFLKKNACYILTNPDAINAILVLIKTASAIYADKENRFQETIALNLLQIVFLEIYDKVQRYFTNEQSEGSSRKGQLFKKFIEMVHANCTNQRNVAYYAEQLCISTRYLSAIAREIGSISAKEIIDEFLVLEIKVALQSTNLSLKEIADRYSFPDQSFFGRYFKKHTGASPKEYRARIE